MKPVVPGIEVNYLTSLHLYLSANLLAPLQLYVLLRH